MPKIVFLAKRVCANIFKVTAMSNRVRVRKFKSFKIQGQWALTQTAKYNTNRKNTVMYTEMINYHSFMLNN